MKRTCVQGSTKMKLFFYLRENLWNFIYFLKQIFAKARYRTCLVLFSGCKTVPTVVEHTIFFKVSVSVGYIRLMTSVIRICSANLGCLVDKPWDWDFHQSRQLPTLLRLLPTLTSFLLVSASWPAFLPVPLTNFLRVYLWILPTNSLLRVCNTFHFLYLSSCIWLCLCIFITSLLSFFLFLISFLCLSLHFTSFSFCLFRSFRCLSFKPYVEPLMLLNFEFNADPDPDPASNNIADPDIQPWCYGCLFFHSCPSLCPSCSVCHHKLKKVNIHLVSLYFGGSCLSLESLSIFFLILTRSFQWQFLVTNLVVVNTRNSASNNGHRHSGRPLSTPACDESSQAWDLVSLRTFFKVGHSILCMRGYVSDFCWAE